MPAVVVVPASVSPPKPRTLLIASRHPADLGPQTSTSPVIKGLREHLRRSCPLPPHQPDASSVLVATVWWSAAVIVLSSNPQRQYLLEWHTVPLSSSSSRASQCSSSRWSITRLSKHALAAVLSCQKFSQVQDCCVSQCLDLHLLRNVPLRQ